MLYSKEEIRELCLDGDRFLINDNRYNNKTTLEDLQNRLRRKAKFKEIDLQSKCEEDNSLGDLLLKHADENDDLRVREFLLKNGFKLPEQEQNTPNVKEDRAEPSNKNEDDQFFTLYNKIKEIVASNPNITAEEFCNELKKEKIDIKTTNQDGWNLLYYAVRSEGPGVIDDRIILLKIVELLTNLNIGIDFKDTASKTVLGTAAVNKQADIIKILLDSGKFNEEEKFNALRLAIIQGNVQEVKAFLGYINDESRRAALGLAMNSTQEEITHVLLNFITSETTNVEENRAKSCRSNGNIDNRPVATIPPISTNNLPKIPVITGVDQATTLPNIEENRTSSSNRGNNNDLSNHNTPVVSTMPSDTNAQFSRPNKKETKYKESQENFYTSLKNDIVGVVVTGLFIAAAVMVPSLAGSLVCSVLAILVVMATGLHVKNFTLPSYREMRENKVEPVNPITQTL